MTRANSLRVVKMSEVKLIALYVPCEDVQALRKHPRIKSSFEKKTVKHRIIPCDDSKFRWVLIDAEVDGSIPPDVAALAEEKGYKFETRTATIEIKDLDYHQAMAYLLRDLSSPPPTAFERVGHIAHFNLRDEHLPFKKEIGQLVLDKHKGLRTVVNKVSSLSSEFRVPEIELLAGEPDYVAQVIEGGITYKVDFSKVYWNSRLAGERARVVKLIPENSLIFDVMGGVGAFGIPLAKAKHCFVVSNDLNPEAGPYLSYNAAKNKVADRVLFSNEDGRVFIKEVLDKLEGLTAKEWDRADIGRAGPPAKRQKTENKEPGEPFKFTSIYFLMNLPAIAVEFLDAFRQRKLPDTYVRCYCFAPKDDPLDDIKKRVSDALQEVPKDMQVEFVRNVAPSKNMYVITFSVDFST